MILSLAGLGLLVLACLSLGGCVGMVVMAVCRISAEERKQEEMEELNKCSTQPLQK